MDESGYILNTCGSDSAISGEDCYGVELKEEEYIPIDIFNRAKFNSDDSQDLLDEEFDNIEIIDLVEEVPKEHHRIRMVGFLNIGKTKEINGSNCTVIARERFDRITQHETHFN